MKPTLGYGILTVALLAVVLGTVAVLAATQRPTHERAAAPKLARQTCAGAPVSATIAFDRAGASETAYRFVYDAVFRKDPARAWTLATPNARGGWPQKQWATGDIPVPPEPVSVACTVGAKQTKATEWDALLRINQTYYLTTVVLRAGRWLIDYWGPYPHIVAPQGFAA